MLPYANLKYKFTSIFQSVQFWVLKKSYQSQRLILLNIPTIRTSIQRYVLVFSISRTYLCLLVNKRIDFLGLKGVEKSIPDNHLLDNNVNTVYLYQIYRVILSSFLGIPSEFHGKLDSITRYIFKRSTAFLHLCDFVICLKMKYKCDFSEV